MRDIKRLKKECIGSNGMYVDLNRNEIFPLTTEEIYYLRKLHNDPNLARNVIIRVEKTQSRTEAPKQHRPYEAPKKQEDYRRQEDIKRQQEQARRQQNQRQQNQRQQNQRQQANYSRNNQRKRRPQYRVTRQQPYNGNKHNLVTQLKKELCVLLLVGGISVTCIAGGQLYNSIFNNNPELGDRTNYQTMVNDSDIGIVITDRYQLETNYGESETIGVQEMQNRRETIRSLCNIYQLNYDVVYNFLEKKTDSFSDPGYLEGRMSDVTCKGMQIDARSEEEMLVYMIRIIKQDPARWGIDTSNLYIRNGYASGTDYCEQIEHVSNVLGVDKYLMYAIVQSECGFSSELFINDNNPGGIMNNNGSFWRFDTKEEGFYELGMEIIKYYNWINEPLNDLSPDVIAKIGNIHAPVSDNNENWLPNVLDRLEYAQNNSEALFGESGRGLSH